MRLRRHIAGMVADCTFDASTLTVGSTLGSVTIAHAAHFVARSGGHEFLGPNGSCLLLNVTALSPGFGVTIPIALQTAPVKVGSVVVVPAQSIQVGGCEIVGQ